MEGPIPTTGDLPNPPLDARAHGTVGVRTLSILAALGCVFVLRWAAAVLIPLLLGLTLSYALAPVMALLQRAHLPRAIGAALLIATFAGGLGWTVYALSDDANALVESLPQVTEKIQNALRASQDHTESTIHKVQRAAAQLEQAAHDSGVGTVVATRGGATRVRIERPPFEITDFLWTGALGLASTISQTMVVLFVTFFLLASGDNFRRKIVHIAGPSFARRRITVRALDEIGAQIQRYLLIQVLTSAIVGLVVWLAFSIVGLNHAALWGALAFVLDFVPYVGAMLLTVGSALVAFVQFENTGMAMLVAGIVLTVHTISGNLLTPWLTSRAGRMNAVVVFVAVLMFGWLWGIWGLLLAVPILTTVKAVADRVEGLETLSELLGT